MQSNISQVDILTFMKSNSRHTLNMSVYEALQCKEIAEFKEIPLEHVFDEMKRHKDSMDYRLYGKSLYTKFGLPQKGIVVDHKGFIND